jgi:hypothetical protein
MSLLRWQKPPFRTRHKTSLVGVEGPLRPGWRTFFAIQIFILGNTGFTFAVVHMKRLIWGTWLVVISLNVAKLLRLHTMPRPSTFCSDHYRSKYCPIRGIRREVRGPFALVHWVLGISTSRSENNESGPTWAIGYLSKECETFEKVSKSWLLNIQLIAHMLRTK